MVTICLYRLTRGDYLSTIGELFGVAECTVCDTVIEVCEAIIDALWETAVENLFPNTNEQYEELTKVGIKDRF